MNTEFPPHDYHWRKWRPRLYVWCIYERKLKLEKSETLHWINIFFFWNRLIITVLFSIIRLINKSRQQLLIDDESAQNDNHSTIGRNFSFRLSSSIGEMKEMNNYNLTNAVSGQELEHEGFHEGFLFFYQQQECFL